MVELATVHDLDEIANQPTRRQVLVDAFKGAVTAGVTRNVLRAGAGVTLVALAEEAYAKSRKTAKIEKAIYDRLVEVLSFFGYKAPILDESMSEIARQRSTIIEEPSPWIGFDSNYAGNEFITYGTEEEAKLRSRDAKRPEQSIDLILSVVEDSARLLDPRIWPELDSEETARVGIGYAKHDDFWSVVVRQEGYQGPTNPINEDNTLNTHSWPLPNIPKPSKSSERKARRIGERYFNVKIGHHFSLYIPGLSPERVSDKYAALFEVRNSGKQYNPNRTVELVNNITLPRQHNSDLVFDSSELNQMHEYLRTGKKAMPHYSMHITPREPLEDGFYMAIFRFKIDGTEHTERFIGEVEKSAFHKNAHYR